MLCSPSVAFSNFSVLYLFLNDYRGCTCTRASTALPVYRKDIERAISLEDVVAGSPRARTRAVISQSAGFPQHLFSGPPESAPELSFLPSVSCSLATFLLTPGGTGSLRAIPREQQKAALGRRKCLLAGLSSSCLPSVFPVGQQRPWVCLSSDPLQKPQC